MSMADLHIKLFFEFGNMQYDVEVVRFEIWKQNYIHSDLLSILLYIIFFLFNDS